jgi:hypothetical protein
MTEDPDIPARLSAAELKTLLVSVFRPAAEDKLLAILVDVPNAEVGDTPEWQDRRAIAWEWKQAIESLREPRLDARLYAYENVGSSNADLPDTVFLMERDPADIHASMLAALGRPLPLETVLGETQIVLAPTEFSTTAPLKVLARRHRFRAATMPGFSRAMIPALGLDYEKVHQRVSELKQRLDKAEGASLQFAVGSARYRLEVDLRMRLASASSGLLREMHSAGNLPSGEAYIVPNEGEQEPSATRGELPVQLFDEVVVFRIEANRAVQARAHDPKKTRAAEQEARTLAEEPAYGNIAELGFGVLGEFGVKACGNILLDEKLGLHVAFGRSDHFGGITGPKLFRDPKRVVHLDWVYVPSAQPAVSVVSARLRYPGGREEEIVAKDKYVI